MSIIPDATPEVTPQGNPMMQIAAAHLLLAQHPKLALLPLKWDFSSEWGAGVSVVPFDRPDTAEIVNEFAATVGVEVEASNGYTNSPDGIRRRSLTASVHVGGIEIELRAHASAVSEDGVL
jgi:hypothetical protein